MTQEKTDNPRLEKWLCVDCGQLLGHVKDKHTVRMKRKDLYIQVKGGAILTTCPRCVRINVLRDDNEQQNTIGKEEIEHGL